MYAAIGSMAMPMHFKYREVLLKGRPKHEKWDSFWIKHPPMAPSRWAKIFAPFDALDGFDERIESKKAVYCPRKDPDEGEKEALNRMLCHLRRLTESGRLARMNAPAVSITYFKPCSDKENDWYGRGGQYKTISGTVLKVDFGEVCLKTEDREEYISFDDIREIDEICVHDTAWSFPRN